MSEFELRQYYLQTPRDEKVRSDTEKVVCEVYEFASDCENGGLSQVIYNRSERQITSLLSSLDTIGAADIASKIRETRRSHRVSKDSDSYDLVDDYMNQQYERLLQLLFQFLKKKREQDRVE